MPWEAFIKEEYIQEGRLRAILVRTDAEYWMDLENEVQDLVKRNLVEKLFLSNSQIMW